MHVAAAASMEKEWNGLPAIAVRNIFGQLKTIDRARMRLACKSWKQILTGDDLPATHHTEIPWQFQPEHSVFDSESKRLSIIQFESYVSGEEEKQFRFKLPNFHGDDDIGGGWLCGCSDGWLVIAAGPRSNPDLFLWNPITSSTRMLPPPMSTLGFLKRFDMSKQQHNISNYMKRVQVFSTECIVAVVFADPLGEGEGRQEFLALSTPQDKSWTVFQGDVDVFHDILFHGKLLYALVEDGHHEDKKNSYMYQFNLSNSQVQLCILRCFTQEPGVLGQDLYNKEKMEHPLFNITYDDHYSFRLGEFCGQLLLITAFYDRYTVNTSSEFPVKAFRCLQLGGFTLCTVHGSVTVESLGGNKSVFLADNGFFTISSGVGGVPPAADFVHYKITGDRVGGFTADHGHGVVSERGAFHLLDGRNFISEVEFLSTHLHYRTCLLTPKFI